MTQHSPSHRFRPAPIAMVPMIIPSSSSFHSFDGSQQYQYHPQYFQQYGAPRRDCWSPPNVSSDLAVTEIEIAQTKRHLTDIENNIARSTFQQDPCSSIVGIVPAPQGGYYVATVVEDDNVPLRSSNKKKFPDLHTSSSQHRSTVVPKSTSPKHRFLARASAQEHSQRHQRTISQSDEDLQTKENMRHSGHRLQEHQDDNSHRNSYCSNIHTVRPLPPNFVLSSTTVVLGKGSAPKESSGNRRLNRLIQEYLHDYATSDRQGKIALVSRIVRAVSSSTASPMLSSSSPSQSIIGSTSTGTVRNPTTTTTTTISGFVRFHEGKWWEATEKDARIKVTSMFRDSLHSQYKSSSKSKVSHRRHLRQQQKQKKQQQRERE